LFKNPRESNSRVRDVMSRATPDLKHIRKDYLTMKAIPGILGGSWGSSLRQPANAQPQQVVVGGRQASIWVPPRLLWVTAPTRRAAMNPSLPPESKSCIPGKKSRLRIQSQRQRFRRLHFEWPRPLARLSVFFG
jgi:hypothetical protein